MVVVRLATNTGGSVSRLGGSCRSDGENDSGNLHLDVLLYGYVVATVVVLRVRNEGRYRWSVSCEAETSRFL